MNFGDLNEIIKSIKKFLKKELKDVDIENLDKDKILKVKKNVYPKIIKKYEKADYELFSDICDRFFKPKYPFNDKYVLWPGPNSNTFTAFIGREVPDLKLDLPPTAIGKDFLANGRVFDNSPSRTGYQVSLYGLLGLLVGIEEGLEVNILGLTFGVDPKDFALKLPIAGRIGLQKN